MVPESNVRIVAAQVFVVALLSLAFLQPWFMFFLALDFFLRTFVSPQLSLLAIMARTVFVPLIKAESRLISYPPKKFAAAIGLFVSAGGFLFGLIGFTIVFVVFASILLFFSFLEAAFGLCVGCRIFAFLVKLGWISDEYCPDCVY